MKHKATVCTTFLAAMAAGSIAHAQESTVDSTLERLDLGGDFRLREEVDANRHDADGDSVPLRARPRIRGRVGAKFRVLDPLQVVLRVVTGDADNPGSPHQTLTGAGRKFPISLDRAFLAYKATERLSLAAGKIPHPARRSTLYGDLLWDSDVHLPGLSVALTSPLGNRHELFATAAEYLLIEQGSGEDVHSTAAQLGLDFDVGQDWHIRFLGDAMRHWNLTADGADLLLELNRGNATVDVDGDGDADEFAADFRIFGGTLELVRLPLLAVSTGVFYNFGAPDESEGAAWFAGIASGDDETPGKALVYLRYQRVGREAVFTAFSPDDWIMASGYNGLSGGFVFVPWDGAELHFYSLGQKRITPGDASLELRTRVDFTVSF